MDGYLAKPFKAHELFATVEGWRTEPAAAPVASAAATQPSVVDLEWLRGQLRAAGAEAALDGIVDTFLAGSADRVTALLDALTDGTPASVARAAHAFKSSAGAIGAAGLATLLSDVEEAGRAEQLNDRAELGNRVQHAAAAVETALRAYRGKVAA
jgi:HPt (histidine-containing phosphotransfer) domain-containing protein